METRIIAKSKALTFQVSQNKPFNPPPAKMICLKQVEQIVLGLVKKTLEQASQQSWDRDVLSGNKDI